MIKRNGNRQYLNLLLLAVGTALLVLFGWRWNAPIVAWLWPVLFIRFFRNQDRWYKTLLAVPFMVVGFFFNGIRLWEGGLLAGIALASVRTLSFILALYLDRLFTGRIRDTLATLVYPSVVVIVEFLVSLTEIGSNMAVAPTQFAFTSLIQVASVTGIWGVSFLVSWAASTINTWWDHGFGLHRAVRPVVTFSACLVLVLFLGALRLGLARPTAETVRVAGVTVEHPRDYWIVIDHSTPRDEAHQYEQELREIQNRLFAQSDRAAQFGAKIIFWSEANAVVYEEDEAAFIVRAQVFAREHEVYFVPAILVFRYGLQVNDNKLFVIDPHGEVAYAYEKTLSSYPTYLADGVLHVVDTPYGRLSTAICSDMDFPSYIRQAAVKNADIVLVPAFDWKLIRPYHTEVAMLRALEGGFSVVRQTNQGTSIAVDYLGNVLAYQDFFATDDPLMIVDVPTRGVKTGYTFLGDWFAYACIAYIVGLVGWSVYKGIRRG
jgi:apolipoprotein N-acyltransferase